MSSDFADYLETLGPTVNQGPNAVQKERAYGDLQDEHTQRVVEGVRARFPQYAPSDGLQYIEQERQIDKKLGEADVDFALRLKEAWDRWEFGGSARGVLKALKDQGYAFDEIEIVQANGLRYTIAADPSDVVTVAAIADPFSAWITDGDTSFWSKFVVLFKAMPPAPGWFTAKHVTFTASTSQAVAWDSPFGDATYHVLTGVHSTSTTPLVHVTAKTANGLTLTTDASFTGAIDVLAWQGNDFPLFSVTPSEKNKVCRLIKRWKSGEATFVEFVGVVRGHYWGEAGLDWGDGGLVWGPAAPGEPITIKVEC